MNIRVHKDNTETEMNESESDGEWARFPSSRPSFSIL